MGEKGHNGEFNPFTGSLVRTASQPNIASELIGQNPDIRKLFVSLSYIEDKDEAADFAKCIAKCIKYGMHEKLTLFELILNTRASIKGGRANLIADILAMVRTEGVEPDKMVSKRAREIQNATTKR